MPRLLLFRLPTALRRKVRRNRLATQLALLLLALALAAPFLLLYALYLPPRFLIAHLRARYPDVLWEVSTTRPLVALSLDDAPSSHTDAIARVLAQHDAHATFFVIGSQADAPAREATLRDLVARGHELANHGERDEPALFLPDHELGAQLRAVSARLTAAYADRGMPLPNNYYRPGSGLFGTRMRALVGSEGWRIVLGSVYPHDAQLSSPGINARHVLSMVHPGAIIVCHDRRDWTAPMLRIVLPELKRRGYRVVTITDLVKSVEPWAADSS